MELGINPDDDTKPLTPLHIYKQQLQVPFIEETEAFYVAESATFLQHNPVTEYIKRIEVGKYSFYLLQTNKQTKMIVNRNYH